jgi:hypothetical protein
MKKIMVLISAFLLISLMGYTVTILPEAVPSPVKEAFSKAYPAAKDVKYEMENMNYEISFKDMGHMMWANYDPEGKWLQTETKIEQSDLPKEVAAALTSNFSGYRVSRVTKLETPDIKLCYELNLTSDKDSYTAQIAPNGSILKKTPLMN